MAHIHLHLDVIGSSQRLLFCHILCFRTGGGWLFFQGPPIYCSFPLPAAPSWTSHPGKCQCALAAELGVSASWALV